MWCLIEVAADGSFNAKGGVEVELDSVGVLVKGCDLDGDGFDMTFKVC